jgi:hypothetical protein
MKHKAANTPPYRAPSYEDARNGGMNANVKHKP